MQNLGIYIHIPYCIKKCRYCDFYSHTPDSSEEISGYFEKLRKEIMESAFLYRNQYSVDTVFFGGGTPTLVPYAELVRTLNCIKQNWRLDSDAEISLESNPGTLTPEKLEAYKRAGFNRISLGIQSLDDNVLKQLGRIHDSDTARTAFRMLAGRAASEELKFEPFNRNVDLMFGVPGQNLDIWADTVDEVISWRPEHISFYSLQLEEETPLFCDYKSGKVNIPSWEENRQMYHLAVKELKKAGYHHYEISNAALPGFECRHNLKYWHMKPYLGFGDSAWSYIDGSRFSKNEGGKENVTDQKGDFIFTEFRLVDGFLKSEYRELFESEFEEDFAGPLKLLVKEGLVEINDERVRLTDKGLDYTNPVMERLLNYE